jgi:hypothetical protein
MFHRYEKNQRRLTIGEIDVTFSVDLQVRIKALQTDLQRVTNIEQKNNEACSLAQKEDVAIQFCSSGLPTYLQTVLLSSISTTHTKLKK